MKSKVTTLLFQVLHELAWLITIVPWLPLGELHTSAICSAKLLSENHAFDSKDPEAQGSKMA